MSARRRPATTETKPATHRRWVSRLPGRLSVRDRALAEHARHGAAGMPRRLP